MSDNKMNLNMALEYVCSIDAELEAIERLFAAHKSKHEKTIRNLCDREKALRSICKWNKHKYQDEAIDVLSDVDNYED